jgi:hypothetical protein
MSPELYTTTVRLSKTQSAWLMTIMASMRRATGTAIDRSAILRAFLDAVASADLDFSAQTTPEEIKKLLADRLMPT